MGEIADDHVDGHCCAGCGVYFAKKHGHPVLCKSCYQEQGEDEPNKMPLATHKEL